MALRTADDAVRKRHSALEVLAERELGEATNMHVVHAAVA